MDKSTEGYGEKDKTTSRQIAEDKKIVMKQTASRAAMFVMVKEEERTKKDERGPAIGKKPQEQNVDPVEASANPVEVRRLQDGKHGVGKPSSTASVEYTGSQEENENLDEELKTQEEEEISNQQEKGLHEPTHDHEEERDTISTCMKFLGRYGFNFRAAIVILLAVVLCFAVYHNNSLSLPRNEDGVIDIEEIVNNFRKECVELKDANANHKELMAMINSSKEEFKRNQTNLQKDLDKIIQEVIPAAEHNIDKVENAIRRLMAMVNDSITEFRRNQTNLQKDLYEVESMYKHRYPGHVLAHLK